MARIPDDQIQGLKAEVSVQRLAKGMGIVLKRHGADLLGLCPFHDGREPSLVITPKSNLWHCLGACQCGGSVIDWLIKAERVSFRHGVELLQADHQPLVAAAGAAKRTTVPKLPTTLAARSGRPADAGLPLRCEQQPHAGERDLLWRHRGSHHAARVRSL